MVEMVESLSICSKPLLAYPFNWQKVESYRAISQNFLDIKWTPGDGDEQGGLACCDSWGRKESDTTERLNWTEGGEWPWRCFALLSALAQVPGPSR